MWSAFTLITISRNPCSRRLQNEKGWLARKIKLHACNEGRACSERLKTVVSSWPVYLSSALRSGGPATPWRSAACSWLRSSRKHTGGVGGAASSWHWNEMNRNLASEGLWRRWELINFDRSYSQSAGLLNVYHLWALGAPWLSHVPASSLSTGVLATAYWRHLLFRPKFWGRPAGC